MQRLELPINYGPNKDIEEIGLSTHGASAVDVYFDSNQNVSRRPGLSSLCDLGTSYGVDGMFWWGLQSKVIAVSGGRIFEITDSNGTFAEIDGDNFEIGAPIYWGDFGDALYGANGGRIVKIPDSGDAAYVADVVAPTTVSHVAVIDDTLLALETGSERAHYSDTSDPDTWSGNWISAISNPDLLVSIGVEDDIIQLLGSKSLEGWRSDGVTPFIKDSQYSVSRGTAAKHSLHFVEGYWYFLDSNRRVVRLVGATPQVISETMNSYIHGFSAVSDAIGTSSMFNGRPQYILIFPTEGKVLIFDVSNETWSELGKWDPTGAAYNQFLGRSFCSASDWNKSLVGSRVTGDIYEWDTSEYTDDGDMLRSMVRTPHVHWDHPELEKVSYRLDFYLKKANVAVASDSAEIMVKWRDNGKTEWGTQRTVSLGRVGRTDFLGALVGLGRYNTRQYEISITDDSPLVISKVIESFDYVGA